MSSPNNTRVRPAAAILQTSQQHGLALAGSLLAVEVADRMYAADLLWAADLWVHADVIDGRFGTRDSLSLNEIHALAHRRPSAVDVHLMVEDPVAWCDELPPVGRVTVQLHDGVDTRAAAASVRRLGAELFWAVDASLASGPSLERMLVALAGEPTSEPHGVLVMLTTPGRSGASLDPERFADVRIARRVTTRVGVDGGVGEQHLDALAAAGASYVVCGRSLFPRNQHDH
jgi:ribulose-phosphate 3-epimerase